MTKHITHEDALKTPLSIEDGKIEVAHKILDPSLVIGGSQVVRKPKTAKVRMEKTKMSPKKTSRLENATAHLYDLEDAHEAEKPLNIDFGLYQMENY